MPSAVFSYILVRSAGLPPLSLAVDWPDEAAQTNAENTLVQHLQQAFDAVLTSLPDSPERTIVYNNRKRFFQKRQLANGLERTLQGHAEKPAAAQLLDYLQQWQILQSQLSKASEHIEAGVLENWRTIQQAAENPDFQRALLFASHDLLDRLPVFCAKAPEKFTAKDRQTGLAVLQYLNRGAYKTSPLSRFTTVTVWPWLQSPTPPGEALPDFMQAAKAVVTPNVALLPALYEVLLTEPAFYKSLALLLNPCITTTSETSGRQWLYFDGEQESFQKMAHNPAVEAVIGTFLEQQGKISWNDLIRKTVKKIQAEEKEVEGFILELIDLGLLSWHLSERGLAPNWCGVLYNYLGHLPMRPVISEAAALLQWLRTAARTLPFQTVPEAQQTLRQTVLQVRTFFETYQSAAPPIPPEQIFFEDVEKPVTPLISPETVQQLANQLANCWRQSGAQRASPFRSALHAFTGARLAEGESRPFLDFCQQFLREKADWEKQESVETPLFSGKIGALLQVFQKADGSYGAVVNGLFPGGGKLMARWTHLFPADFRTALQHWFPENVLPFPWQGWSNANFQPMLTTNHLAVPDGRLSGNDLPFLLGNLDVQRGPEGPFLIDRDSKRPVRFTDLGLEAPATRPPVMQVLWHLGMPAVSLECLRPAGMKETDAGWRPRVEFQTLVLRRASWRIVPEIWKTWLIPTGTLTERLLHIRRMLLQQALPPCFFVRFQSVKPQFMEQNSPAGLLFLEKMLKNGKGDLWVEEMLPGNEHRAEEWVVELDVSAVMD